MGWWKIYPLSVRFSTSTLALLPYHFPTPFRPIIPSSIYTLRSRMGCNRNAVYYVHTYYLKCVCMYKCDDDLRKVKYKAILGPTQHKRNRYISSPLFLYSIHQIGGSPINFIRCVRVFWEVILCPQISKYWIESIHNSLVFFSFFFL